MKHYVLLISVFLCATALEARTVTVKTTKCYCSDKCGPRDITSDDKPFVDEETGIFFCKQRDKDNYEPSECALKPCHKKGTSRQKSKKK